MIKESAKVYCHCYPRYWIDDAENKEYVMRMQLFINERKIDFNIKFNLKRNMPKKTGLLPITVNGKIPYSAASQPWKKNVELGCMGSIPHG